MKMINIYFFTIVIGLFNCCNNNKDRDYFNGDIRYFDTNREIVNVASKSVKLEGVYSGSIAAYDSLLIFWYPASQGNFYSIFNVDTGEELGSFCEKGQGPREVSSVNCIFQVFKKENDIMTLLYAHNEGRLFFWNINRSVEKGQTVYDTIVPYKNNRIFSLYYQSENILFANKPSDIENEAVSTPYYEKRTIYTNELIQNYPIYKKSSLQSGNAAAGQLRFFFYTWDAIKPDGSKIAQAMWHLPQINILDTNTGDVVGYRMKNGPNFSLLETDLKSMNVYYNTIQADNNYIYATYWGKEMWNDRMLPFINTIHVFDWNGKLLYEIVTDRSFFRSMWLDQVRNRIYTIDVKTDDVYYLDLNELGIFSNPA
jgi:hypothetical protein